VAGFVFGLRILSGKVCLVSSVRLALIIDYHTITTFNKSNQIKYVLIMYDKRIQNREIIERK